MVAGHLAEKNDSYYVVLNYKNLENKRVQKWIPTGLPVKGNKRKAENMLQDTRKNFKIPTSLDEEILFSEFLKKWLAIVKPNLAVTTYAEYHRTIEHSIAPYFTARKIRLVDLKPKDIQEFYQHETDERPISTNSLLRYHANIRKALQYAFKLELITSNPADKVERPKAKPYIANYLTEDSINLMLVCFQGSTIEIPVMLSCIYGLRRSEALGLRWSAIDFVNRTISIDHTVISAKLDKEWELFLVDGTKTKSSTRTLPLIPQMEDYLNELKEKQAMNKAIMGNSYNTAYEDYICVDAIGNLILPYYVTDKFRREIQKYGLPKIRFHDLRHSCASILLANGVDLKLIQQWLGHSNYATTANIYAHVDYRSKISTANVLNNSLRLPALRKENWKEKAEHSLLPGQTQGNKKSPTPED